MCSIPQLSGLRIPGPRPHCRRSSPDPSASVASSTGVLAGTSVTVRVESRGLIDRPSSSWAVELLDLAANLVKAGLNGQDVVDPLCALRGGGDTAPLKPGGSGCAPPGRRSDEVTSCVLVSPPHGPSRRAREGDPARSSKREAGMRSVSVAAASSAGTANQQRSRRSRGPWPRTAATRGGHRDLEGRSRRSSRCCRSADRRRPHRRQALHRRRSPGRLPANRRSGGSPTAIAALARAGPAPAADAHAASGLAL